MFHQLLSGVPKLDSEIQLTLPLEWFKTK
jgi:hypothetical protein